MTDEHSQFREQTPNVCWTGHLPFETPGKHWCRSPPEVRLETTLHLSIRELSVIGDTELYGEHTYGELWKRVTVLLETWHLDGQATVNMMERTKSIMSGSGALFIVAPKRTVPGDLDFYAPEGRVDEVVEFFKEQWYQVEPPPSKVPGHAGVNATYDSLHMIKRVIIMEHVEVAGLKLNIIESGVPSVEAPIFAFHSTVVMNAVTSSGVICFYPELTLKDQGMNIVSLGSAIYSPRGSAGVVHYPNGFCDWIANGAKDREAIDKYTKRGYELFDDCKKTHKRGQDICKICTLDYRRWDEGSISMPFRKGDIVHPTNGAYTWRLGVPPMRERGWQDRGVSMFCNSGFWNSEGYVYDGVGKTIEAVSCASGDITMQV